MTLIWARCSTRKDHASFTCLWQFQNSLYQETWPNTSSGKTYNFNSYQWLHPNERSRAVCGTADLSAGSHTAHLGIPGCYFAVQGHFFGLWRSRGQTNLHRKKSSGTRGVPPKTGTWPARPVIQLHPGSKLQEPRSCSFPGPPGKAAGGTTLTHPRYPTASCPQGTKHPRTSGRGQQSCSHLCQRWFMSCSITKRASYSERSP